jgi:hypothetical protein
VQLREELDLRHSVEEPLPIRRFEVVALDARPQLLDVCAVFMSSSFESFAMVSLSPPP